MGGKQKSVYVTDEEDEIIERHAARHDRSYSWAKRDLILRGEKVRGLRESIGAGYDG